MSCFNISIFRPLVILLFLFFLLVFPCSIYADSPFSHFVSAQSGLRYNFDASPATLPQAELHVSLGSYLIISEFLRLSYSFGFNYSAPSLPVLYRLRRGSWGFPFALAADFSLGKSLSLEAGGSLCFSKYLNTDLSFLSLGLRLCLWLSGGGKTSYRVGFPIGLEINADSIALSFSLAIAQNWVPSAFSATQARFRSILIKADDA